MDMPETAVLIERNRKGYLSAILEAIRGSQQDFTEGSLRRAIVLLAIPMVLEMVMESLFAIVDVFWVAHLGANAIATVGLSESILMLVYCGAMGLSMAITAMVARRIGEKDYEGAAVATVQAMAIAIAAAVVIATAGIRFAPTFLAIMGASPDVIATGHRYAAVMLGSSLCIVLLFVNNGVFRGAGDAAIAMRVLALEHHQSAPRPMLHFRAGTVSEAWRDRSRGLDDGWPEHWRGLSDMDPLRWEEPCKTLCE